VRARTIHSAILTIQPSISPVPGIIFYQSINLCYLHTRLASSTLHFMRPRQGVPKNSPLDVYPSHLPSFPASVSGACGDSSLFRESPVTNHTSPTLPPFSFQSLTNCPSLFAHRQLFYFQQVLNCPFCNHFVLTTIQIAGGWGYPLRSGTSRKTLTPLVSYPVSSTFVPRIGRSPVRGLPSHFFPGYETLATGHRSATPLECAVPRFRALSPLECADPKTPRRNPFRMRSSEKRWGVG